MSKLFEEPEENRPSKPKLEKVPTRLRKFAEQDPKLADDFTHVTDLIKQIRAAERAGDKTEATKWQPPVNLMKMFWERAEKLYNEIPFTKEEIEHELSPEKLSSLSIKQYVDLLKKLPPRLITHVVRQGVRDHVSHHEGGMGAFHHGFEGIVQTGEVRSILEQDLLGEVTRDSVERLLTRLGVFEQKFGTREKGLQRVHDLLETNIYTSPRVLHEVSDTRSIHLSLEIVADANYGGESGNEIFFVYPAAFIAAHCIVSAQMGVPEGFHDTRPSSEWNDIWLLEKQSKAGRLPVDAALTFIPEDAAVHPETGSRYETNPDGTPLNNQAQLDALLAFEKKS